MNPRIRARALVPPTTLVWLARLCSIALALPLLASACSSTDESEDTASVDQAISGSAAQIDNVGLSSNWISAVGRFNFQTPGGQFGACTGTVVAPNVVLSAGHCFNGQAQAAGTFVIPTAAPIGGVPQGSLFTITSWKRITGSAPDPHDIACAVLQNPVPSTLVPSIPRVYTSPMVAALQKYILVEPAFMAGFGSFVASENQSSTLSDGNRRWGVASISLVLGAPDPCGDALIAEQHCNDDWEFELDRTLNPQPERGDSGGPLLLTGPDGPIIAGIYSGYWKDGYPADTTSHSVWAPTGSPGGTNNGSWILENCLGGDDDGDQVPDLNDNCPPSFCASNPDLDPEDCVNPAQEDWDNDGIGEKCDNCPQSVCDLYEAQGGLPPNVTCLNPGQSNIDHDSRGDACDLCPNGTTIGQSDDDGDGVGDECDFCEKSDPYASCMNSASCFGSVCLIEPGAGVGHCAEPTDTDGDGVSDACDECPGFESDDETNTNDLAEEREKKIDVSVTSLADACDPVPIVRIKSQKAVPITPSQLANLTPGDGLDADDVSTLSQDGWLGVDIENQTNVATVQRAIAYRHCTCVGAGGEQLELAACTKSNGPCPSTAPLTNSNWSAITLQTSTGAPYVNALGVTTPRTFHTSQLSPNVPSSVTWQWREDVLAGQVDGLGTCPGTEPLDCKTHGALFAGTQKTAPYASPREEDHVLGDVFQLIDTPGLSLSIDQIPNICQPPCLPHQWMRPDYLVDPDPFGFTGLFDHPSPVSLEPAGIGVIVSPTRELNITAYVDAVAAAALQGDGQWLTGVESLAFARRSRSMAVRNGIHAVVLEQDFDGQPPLAISITKNGVAGRVRAEIEALAFGEAPLAMQGVRGVFSAVESAVYMVGGRIDSQPTNSIWRWSLTEEQWGLINVLGKHVPSSNVLSLGYTPDGQHLYVLDIDDHDILKFGIKPLKFARLYRVDLATGTTTLLLRVPYLGIATPRIAVMPDGGLVLVSAAKKVFTVWRLNGLGEHATFGGVFLGKGKLLDGPVMGEDRLYVAVEVTGKVEVIDLAPERFHGGPPCTSL